MDYTEFLKTKIKLHPGSGIEINKSEVNPKLFPFQRDLVVWALKKGRAAIFADTGLGKTAIQLQFAKLCGERALIIAPLSIAKQTVGEGRKFDVNLKYARDTHEAAGHQLVITNYEHSHKFSASDFGCVVLDESSSLKSTSSKYREQLTKQWQNTRFRLCCTATPAPNDHTELGNHSEFLGISKMQEMLATYFVRDAGDTTQAWRLKRHAVESFYRWLASWGISLRRPSDLGYSDEGYILPPLDITPEWIESEWKSPDSLFADKLGGLHDRLKIRRDTVDDKVARTASIVNSTPGQWIVWGGLNDETIQLHKAIPGSIHIEGKDSPESKSDAFERFVAGQHRVLVSKVKIAGFGMNFQNCHQMAFCGVNDSWEMLYQAIRRVYRFGQHNPVDVRIVLTEPEDAIYQNLLSKEREANKMREGLLQAVKGYELEELQASAPRDSYQTMKPAIVPEWVKTNAMRRFNSSSQFRTL